MRYRKNPQISGHPVATMTADGGTSPEAVMRDLIIFNWKESEMTIHKGFTLSPGLAVSFSVSKNRDPLVPCIKRLLCAGFV